MTAGAVAPGNGPVLHAFEAFLGTDPEYGRNGEQYVVVQQLLSRRAGLPSIRGGLLPSDVLEQSAEATRRAAETRLEAAVLDRLSRSVHLHGSDDGVRRGTRTPQPDAGGGSTTGRWSAARRIVYLDSPPGTSRGEARAARSA